jgi:acyl carrier protein
MENDELYLSVRSVCAEVLGVPVESVTPGSSLRDDLDADSLDVAELAMALEDKVGGSLSEQKMKDVVTVSDAVDLVRQSLSAAAS